MLKLFLIALAIGLSGASIVMAQDPQAPPAPPPPIKASAKAVTPRILPADGFNIKFPAAPRRTVSKVVTAFGPQDHYQYTLSTAFAFYNAGFLDFPAVVTDADEKRLRIELVKNAYLKPPGSKLISETEIFFGEHLGADLVVESPSSTITSRIIFIEQRFFQLIVITKGQTSRSTPKLRAYNKKLVDDFFDSFEVTSIPSTTHQTALLPADFGISVNDGLFRSDFFAMSMSLPPGWVAADREQTAVVKDLAAVETDGLSGRTRKEFDLSIKNTEVLLVANQKGLNSTDNSALLIIAAEKVSFPNFLPEKVIEGYLTSMVPSEKVVIAPTKTSLGGADFVWVETERTDTKVRQRMYMANRKGICFEVLFTFKDPADLARLQKALATIRFDK